MPTYEYKCSKCKKVFDVFQKITEKPLKKCPKCSSLVERLISKGAGLIFKGSGFYATDYRSKSYKEGKRKEHGNEISCPAKGTKSKCNSCPAGGD